MERLSSKRVTLGSAGLEDIDKGQIEIGGVTQGNPPIPGNIPTYVSMSLLE